MRTGSKLLIFCLSIIASAASANEDKPYYFEFGFGRSSGYVPYTGELPSGHYGGASVSSVALGKQFNEKVAFDVELSYRGDYTNNDDNVNTVNGVQNGNISVNSLTAMLNGYYYYYNQILDFRPYITGGAGISRNKTSNMTLSSGSNSQVSNGTKTDSFSWKLGTGIKYKLDSNFEADLRYQYVSLGDVKMNNSESTYTDGALTESVYSALKSSRLYSHEIMVGIAYKF